MLSLSQTFETWERELCLYCANLMTVKSFILTKDTVENMTDTYYNRTINTIIWEPSIYNHINIRKNSFVLQQQRLDDAVSKQDFELCYH